MAGAPGVWSMSAEAAARIRTAPAVTVLDNGAEHINRVVETPEFGLVIDRRPKPRQSHSLMFTPPGFMPKPHFEHDILRGLNAAGASFVQEIHYADDRGLILQFAEGHTPTEQQWYTDAELRGEYSLRFAAALGELADISDVVRPRVTRPEERRFWPERVQSTTHFGQLMRDRTIMVGDRALSGPFAALLNDIGSTRSVAEELAEFDITGDRPVLFQHNDMHPFNTVQSPFKIIDWSNGGDGDSLWTETKLRACFPTELERDRFSAHLAAELPPTYLRGADHDRDQYENLNRQLSRTVSAVLISESALEAVQAAAGADTSLARREAVRPQAARIHERSGSFAGHPVERTAEQTTDLLMEHVARHLGRPTLRQGGAAAAARVPTPR